MDPKRIVLCFQIDGASYFGGIATMVNGYLAHSDEFFSKGYSLAFFNHKKKRIFNIPKIGNILYAADQKRALKKYLKEEKTDLLHIQTSRKWLLLKDLILARSVKKRTGVKICMTIHFCDIEKILYQNPLIRRMERKLLLSGVDELILLSEKTRNEFGDFGFPIEKTEVLYTFHLFGEIGKTERPDGRIQMLFVGSIDSRKGILDLLQVLNKVKEVRDDFCLHICGQVTEKAIENEYRRLVDALGECAILHGYVSGEEKKRIFADSDILILPSYAEGMPIVIMEALAAGCAVISTSVGAIPEIVKPENGILIEPGDRDALKQAILDLLTDRERLRSMQEENRRKSREYSAKRHIEMLLSIYEKAVEDE